MTQSARAFLVLAGFLMAVSTGGGCKIYVAPSTQLKMAQLETSRSFALAYARAAKTKDVVDDPTRQTLAGLYSNGAKETTTFVNLFVRVVDSTSLFDTIDAKQVDPQADAATAELDKFLAKARQEIDDKIRPADFGATAAAILLALEGAQKIAALAEKWWNEATERERTRFKDQVRPLAMPAWVEVQPLEVKEK